MPALVDIKGKQFGRLTAIEYVGKRKWLCKCTCGNTKEINSGSLLRGVSKSCGCYRKEFTKANNTRHGMSKTKVHECWKNMMQRCYNKNNTGYKNYGARGITVCESWHKFENFYAAMGNPPAGHSLDRIDVNGNYEPSNCRWVTQNTQQRNRRNSLWVDGLSLQVIADELGIPYHTLHSRLYRAQQRKLTE